MAADVPDEKFQIACKPCTERLGRPVLAMETGRFTSARDTPGAPAPGLLGVRLMCPVCSKQSFFFPTVKHYECEQCGHVKETYVRGDTSETPRGISFRDTVDSKQESQGLLDQLRRGSIGGWGSA